MNLFTVFLVLITIVSLLLMIVIMVQNPKGGGLDSSLGGSTSIGGVQNTNKFLDKSTWTLAITLVVLILLSSLSFNANHATGSKILDSTEAATLPTVPSNAAPTNTTTEKAAATPASDNKK